MKSIQVLLAAWLMFSTMLVASEELGAVEQRFRDLLKAVDRVKLVDRSFGLPGGEDSALRVWRETVSPDALAELGKATELQAFELHCLCLTSPEIHFYRGDHYLFALTLHHGYKLRGEDGPWDGDVSLTDESAAKFRAWFAAQGYDGFVREAAAVEEWQRKRNAREAVVLAHFPRDLGALFFQEQTYDRQVLRQRQERLTAVLARPEDRLVACWRGLGEIAGWEQANRSDDERLMLAVLGDADEAAVRSALAQLAAGDVVAWCGAYLHWNDRERGSTEAIRTVVGDAELAKMARAWFERTDGYRRASTVWTLGQYPGPATIGVLTEIARSGVARPDRAEGRRVGSGIDPAEIACLVLAKLRRPEAGPLIAEARARQNDESGRVVLEVAQALLDGPAQLGLRHVTVDSEQAAEAAWQMLAGRPESSPSLELIAGAAAAKSHAVKKAAEALLLEHGVKPLSVEDRVSQELADPRCRDAMTIAALEARLSELRDPSSMTGLQPDVRQGVVAHLRGRLVKAYLDRGDFAAAGTVIESGQVDRGHSVDRDIVLQALGRLSEAYPYPGRERAGFERAAQQLERRGFVEFARGKFVEAERDFDAASRLEWSGNERRKLFGHLALMLAGKSAEPEVRESAEDRFPGLAVGDDAAFWPETGLQLLRGKVTEEAVLGRIMAQPGKQAESLCEARFALSVLRRIAGDRAGEVAQLRAAVETRAYREQGYSLARLRLRDLEVEDAICGAGAGLRGR